VVPHSKGSPRPQIHRGRCRDTHRGIHGRDRQQIGRYVLLDLLRDIDGLSLVAKRRQDFNDTSKKNIARYQKKIEHEDRRKQAVEDGACPSEKCAGYAEIAANRYYRTPARGSVRSLLGPLEDILQCLDWPFYNLQMGFQARDALGQAAQPNSRPGLTRPPQDLQALQ